MGVDDIWGVSGKAERGRKRRKKRTGGSVSEELVFALNAVHPS